MILNKSYITEDTLVPAPPTTERKLHRVCQDEAQTLPGVLRWSWDTGAAQKAPLKNMAAPAFKCGWIGACGLKTTRRTWGFPPTNTVEKNLNCAGRSLSPHVDPAWKRAAQFRARRQTTRRLTANHTTSIPLREDYCCACTALNCKQRLHRTTMHRNQTKLHCSGLHCPPTAACFSLPPIRLEGKTEMGHLGHLII